MMKPDGYVSTTMVVVVVLWTVVAALMIASWVVVVASPLEHRQIGYLLGLTAATLACVATVAHIRIYALRVSAMIRVTAGLTRPGPMGPSEDLVPSRLRSVQNVH